MRYCFVLQVRPELVDQYRARHEAVSPDMIEALDACGWHRYSLFLRPDGLLVGYVESDDLAQAQRAVAETAANTRWQAEMSHYFVGLDGRGPDEDLPLLEQIFDLDEQLAQVRGATLEGAGP